jgi:hypothetical protein
MNRTFIFLVLSIAALPLTVKAQEKNLPSFKKGAHDSNSGDATRNTKKDIAKLTQLVMDSGDDIVLEDGFAQAVTLEESLPAKYTHADISEHGDKTDSRECHVVYRSDDSGKRAICLLLSRYKGTRTDMHAKYYRMNLNGTLENAVTLNNKRGSDGDSLPEGRSRVVEDVASAETRKAFKTELEYWVKTWLKKHPKGVTKTDAPAAIPAASPAPAP